MSIRHVMSDLLLGLALLLSANGVVGYYLPGVYPTSFKKGDSVELKVNKMTSTHTLMPLDYYRLPFCMPAGGIKRSNENLGEFLAGDRIENSPYILHMKEDFYCEQVCTANLGRGESAGLAPNKVVRAIHRNYHNNWIVDNLPSASKMEDDSHYTTRYWQGFPLGFIHDRDAKAYIHNHVNIEISYHEVETEPNSYRVVRFVVEPFSIHHEYEPITPDSADINDDSVLPKVAKIKNPIASCKPNNSPKEHTSYEMVIDGQPQPASGQVLFTYDVKWIENQALPWSSRWDIYLTMDHAVPALVHWTSITNSLMIVLVLSGLIAAILVRLYRDINRYNRVAMDEVEEAADAEEPEEYYGWRAVHADVFRPPPMPMLLSVMCGTGAQFLCMSFLVIFFAALGFMSPARRGHLLVVELILFVVLGGLNGYVTARLYKTFKGDSWQRAAKVTALGFPGIAFSVFLLMNCVAWFNESTDAVPFTTLLTLIVLWFGISLPLVFGGAFLGNKQNAIEFPVKTRSIPRQIPDQPWFMAWPCTLGIGGMLPFASCFVELYYILASVWMGYYYYVFGFLLLVFVILIVTCAEITVLLTHFQLCRGNYHWWWRSFCNAGSTAIYVFMYSIYYFRQLEANVLATYVLYFGYMALVSASLFTMMGCVGLLTSLWFNKAIFASIKIDRGGYLVEMVQE